MIRTIEIENIKGIGSGINKKIFNLNILPNKPSLVIAPNGFGKSSFSTAFKSLKRNRIDLEEENEINKNLMYFKMPCNLCRASAALRLTNSQPGYS